MVSNKGLLVELVGVCAGLQGARLLAFGCQPPSGGEVITGLLELLQLIPQSHRSVATCSHISGSSGGSGSGIGSGRQVLVVGYCMKASREAKLAARGMLPLVATGGLAFQPIQLRRQAAEYGVQGLFDAVLHKVSWRCP